LNTLDAKPAGQRLVSVDALRGFDMFWIVGAESLVQAFSRMSPTPVSRLLANQLEHAEWQGFHFYDPIFPLFLFIVGVSIVPSMDRLLANSGRKGALARIARRSVLLFLLGVFYYGGVTRVWCRPLVWMGTNAITIYLVANILGGFNSIAVRLASGDVQRFVDAHVAKGCGDLLIAVVGLVLAFWFVGVLYRRKIFLRV
jgi:predicted acyltransferase